MSVFIIAEAGINANGNIELAKQQIDLACACGADAVKFQAYDTHRLYSGDTHAPTYKDSLRGQFSQKDLRVLADYADGAIEWFATPFDLDMVSLLESIGVKRYKIASRSLRDHGLLKAIASTKKPVIMSTGNHPIDTVGEAMKIFEGVEVSLLYCVPNYPTMVENLDFNRMITLNDFFAPARIGFSDHTQGIWASIEAVNLGATVIEKHFTATRGLDGCDQSCSLEPAELKLLVKSIRQLERYHDASRENRLVEANSGV